MTITSASVPGLPTTPDVRRNLALGILIGLALGVGLAMVRHALDTKVRGEADLKAASDRPVAQIRWSPPRPIARSLWRATRMAPTRKASGACGPTSCSST
ncbi:MAG: hypothetical protein IPH03_08905 [Tetrasphaera sp.]|nr:hypothetical protein [Tetrasphaera sp.]